MTCLAVCAAMRPKLSGVDVNGRDLAVVVGGPVDVRRRRLVLLGVNALGDDGLLARERPELLALGEDDLEDPHLAGLAVDVNAGELGRVGRLLVRGEQSVLERHDQGLGVDPLLALDLLDGLDDLSVHLLLPPTN